MTVPTYDRFIEPILRYLAEHPQGAPAREAHEAAAARLGLSDAARAELLPSGVQPVYKNRAGWAHDRLKRAGLSTSPRRGFWRITERGLAFIRQHGQSVAETEIEKIAQDFMDVVLKDRQPDGSPPTNLAVAPGTSPVPLAVASPDDRLEQALAELRGSVSRELLEAISGATPQFFEALVLDLLHAMGYGTNRSDLQRVGGPGDAGIDGIISLDRLGLEKVYVQAKRWKDSNTVGRPDVQAFYGALAGQRANKGVFITTSSFANPAIEFARSVERIVLVDGARLAALMIEHGVGVSNRTVTVPKLDADYFESD
jgi:restriction system protein